MINNAEVAVRVSELEFGALAAERDTGLADYFVASDSFERLLNGTRYVVLGTRGSGKSAIFKMIAERRRASGSIVVELAPDDYSYELLQQVLLAESSGAWAKQGAYAAAWKYLIYVRAMKELAGQKGLKTGPGSRIYNYVRDNHANFDKNPIATMISYLKRLEGFKVGKHEAGLKARELQSLYKLEELEPYLDDLNKLADKRAVVMLIDELDRGWDASEDARGFVAGLFQAAVSIRTRTPNVHVLVSLRKELYDNIPSLYEDAQKVRDILEVIEWDEDRLLEVISRRIAHAVPALSDKSDDDRWSAVFAETLEYRNTKSFNYMIDRTLYRPREIIQFCTDTVVSAKEDGVEPPLNYPVVSKAEHRYSGERLKDIAAEYRFQYPGLGSVFECFRGGPQTYSKDELDLLCLSMIVGEKRIDPEAIAWIERMEPDDLIATLWTVGFLRAQAVGGLKARRRSGSQYLGSHQIASLNLRDLSRFHVHPMFRSYLGTKESSK